MWITELAPFRGHSWKLGTHTLNINLSGPACLCISPARGFHISDLPLSLCISWSPFTFPSFWLPLFLLDLVHHTCLCTGVYNTLHHNWKCIFNAILLDIKLSRAESMSYLSVFSPDPGTVYILLQMFIWMSKSFETTLFCSAMNQGLPVIIL